LPMSFLLLAVSVFSSCRDLPMSTFVNILYKSYFPAFFTELAHRPLDMTCAFSTTPLFDSTTATPCR
jgi:hypothetical protein